MRIFESRSGLYPRTRHVAVVGEYDHDNIVYNEGYSMGCSILFDSRRFVMSKQELNENFERCEKDDSRYL